MSTAKRTSTVKRTPVAAAGRKSAAAAGIGRTVLREQVKDLLLERILVGQYAPGERLVETRIAQELGVSQAPVREALLDLEALRFVESIPFRGARVREVTLDEILEIYPVRSALEEVAVREAAIRLDGDVSGLVAELKAMRIAAKRGDVSGQVDHDTAFHRVIIEASGNRTLGLVWESLGIHGRTAVTFLKSPLTASEVVESHVPILEAIQARDSELAAARIREHFETFADALRKERQAT